MRWSFPALLMIAIALAVSGCGGKKRAQYSGAARSGDATGLAAPSTALVGRIVSVNPSTRFAVLNFPINKLPALEQRLSVYRQGVKVGEVKVTGQQRDDYVAADIMVGEAAVGDEVRDR